MDRAPSPESDRSTARGILRLGRLFLVLVVLVAVAMAVTMYAPGAVDVFSDGPSPFQSESAPPATDAPPEPAAGDAANLGGQRRDPPEPADPEDPRETVYQSNSGAASAFAVEYYVHQAVNDRRADRGLDPVAWDGTIASVSRAHSADMAEREYFDHETPRGDDPLDRFDAVASYCRTYGENIAMTWLDTPVERPDDRSGTVTYRTAEELAEGLVEQWMHSPPHREAILDPSWDRGGVGVYLDDDGQTYATHNFCVAW